MNDAVCSHPAALYTKRKSLARRRTQRRMSERVIKLVGELAETQEKVAQRPYSVVLGVDRLGDLSCVLHELGVSSEVMNEHRVGGAKETLANTTETGLSRRSCLFRAFVAREKRLEVNAFELCAAVDNDHLRKPGEAPHDLA